MLGATVLFAGMLLDLVVAGGLPGPEWRTVVSAALLRAVDGSSLRARPDHPGRRRIRAVAVDAAERGRLLRKGQTLFEHCVEQRSAICVLGFVEYEIDKSLEAALPLLEFAGWMQEQREALDGDEEALAHRMIDIGLSLIHGLTLDEAEELFRAGRP